MLKKMNLREKRTKSIQVIVCSAVLLMKAALSSAHAVLNQG